MRAWEFEDAVWATEGIRIVIRTASGTEVGDYDFDRAAIQTWRLSELMRNRIDPLLNGEGVVAIRGNGTRANGGLSLRRLRDSYGDD
jgi:hypothetical protein